MATEQQPDGWRWLMSLLARMHGGGTSARQRIAAAGCASQQRSMGSLFKGGDSVQS